MNTASRTHSVLRSLVRLGCGLMLLLHLAACTRKMVYALGVESSFPPSAGIIHYQTDASGIQCIDARGKASRWLLKMAKGDSLFNVAFTPDASGFAYLHDKRGIPDTSHTITICYASAGNPTSSTLVFKDSAQPKIFGWSSDGRRLYFLSAKLELCRWDRLTRTGCVLRRIDDGERGYETGYWSWDHAGDFYVIKRKPQSHAYEAFDYETGRRTSSYHQRGFVDAQARCLGLTPNGRQMVLWRKRYSWLGYATGGALTIPVGTLWDFMNGEMAAKPGPLFVLAPVVVPVGLFGMLYQDLFTEPFARYAVVDHDLAVGQEVFALDGPGVWPDKLAWSPDGKRFALLNSHPNHPNMLRWLMIGDVERQRWLGMFEFPGMPADIVWSPDNQWVAVIGKSYETNAQTRLAQDKFWIRAYHTDGAYWSEIMRDELHGVRTNLTLHAWAQPKGAAAE